MNNQVLDFGQESPTILHQIFVRIITIGLAWIKLCLFSFSGILRDSSGTYNVSFQFCGSLGLIGGLVLLLEYFITRWRTKTSATAGAAPIPEAA